MVATRNSVPALARTVALTIVAVGASCGASAKTLRSITIDGAFDDWTEVLLDGHQTVADRSEAQGDPDVPGQAQRDERGVAVTWDATRLYLYFTRTGAGTNSFNAVFYLDIDHDRLLEASDEVAFFKFSGSSFGGLDLVRYDDGGTPDPLTGDGVTPLGSGGATISTTGAAAATDATGIRFEASVTWATLGVPAGTPMFIHPSLSSNQNIPGGVLDNCNPIDTQLPALVLTGGGTRGTAPGRTVDFAHRVTNDGSAADTINLAPRTVLGFAVAVHTDPNGDGDPADGVLMARDANGDGDYTDTVDVPPGPAHDADADDRPDGGMLAPGAFRDVVLRIGVPPAQAEGTEETVRLAATSAYRPSVRQQVEDRVRVGLLTITPPGATVATSALAAQFPQRACNDSGVARVLDVAAVSAAGWVVTLLSDPDGNGNPADGAPLGDTDGDGKPDLGSLPDGACVDFVVSVAIPPGTPAGVQDLATATVSDGALEAEVVDVVDTVGARVDVAPDRIATSQQGKTLYLGHRVRNAANVVDAISLSTTSTLGSQTSVLDDANGDGDPDSSVVIVNTGLLPPSGGSRLVLARVRVPTTAVHGDVDMVTVRGTSDGSGVAESALDTVNVSGLLTYSDALFARPAARFFGQCATVYGLAYRSGGGTFRFVWLDAAGATLRLGPDISPYADGSLDDFLDLGGSPLQGTWTVKLQEKSGSTYADVGPSGTWTFDVLDLVSAGAGITLLDTGSDLHLLAGDDLVGLSEVGNPTSADVLDSTIEYVAFRDANGDGVPTAGEDWVRADGTVAPWAPGSFTSLSSDIDVFSGETHGDRFEVQAVSFGTAGAWTLQATWRASCGFLLDVQGIDFTAGCEPPPTFSGIVSGADNDSCVADGIRLAWNAATSWGMGASGTYSVFRSTDPGFTPDASSVLASGLVGLSYVDTTAAPNTTYHYVVQAESDVTCSVGFANSGLLDGNLLRASAEDVDVGDVPVASFTLAGTGCLDVGGAVIDFADTSSGPPLSWAWDLDGDTTTDATGPTPSYTYASAGTYPVTLQVTGSCGAAATSVNVLITEAPLAALVADRTETCLGEPVDFDGSASIAMAPASLVDWEWDFTGDGAPDASGVDPAPFDYAAAGSHLAALRVTDSYGCSHVASLPVLVHDALAATFGAGAVVDHCTGTVRVTASGTGGGGGYVLDWLPPFTDVAPGEGEAVLGFGATVTPRVLVTDAAGCAQLVAAPPASVNPQLSASLAPPTVDQCTGTVTLQASAAGGGGSYAYAFDALPGGAAGTVTGVLPPGTHVVTVTVTDALGCTAATSTTPFTIPEPVGLAASGSAPYVYPDVFSATVSAVASGGVAPLVVTWDVGADGTPDGTGTGLTFAMGANETVTVEATVADANGCTAVQRFDVSSAGCPATSPLRRLMVRKAAPAGFGYTWEPSSDACHGRYQLVEAGTPRPAVLPGAWPLDPAWASIQPEDADGSDLDAAFLLADARAGRTLLCFLVRDGGTDGSWAPTLHYDNLTVLPQ
jgi:PKD repeat protein